MSRKFTTVLWDLDGTLVDSKIDIIDCLCSSAEVAGISAENLKEKFQIGPTIKVIVRNAIPEIDDVHMEAVIEGYRKRYDYSSFPKTVPYNGIDDLVHKLTSLNQFVITNKPKLPTSRIIRKFDWDNLFKAVYTPDRMDPSSKLTKVELFAQVIREQRLAVKDCLAIGDTVADIEAAHAAGIQAIGVSWGYTPYNELQKAKPDAVVESAEELLTKLTNK